MSTMITAIRTVHLEHGPWVTDNGYEYNAVLIAALATLVEHGPGRPSVDAALLPGWKGRGWAAASLGAAVAGSYLVTKLSEPEQPAPSTAGASPNGTTQVSPQETTQA
jgi:putative oxidoreductase